ncbi:acyl carrier protein [Nocardia arthritidis]|uniref:Carrier domain-containing protein n=1 Tax=Nocardia arthritidis TaxID=228602 RepID=A0A6G9YBU5_9NOCA|nr:acyl carrier protein [Nocardia arthritidis]QIS10699.1 hypothetical protein F5544_14060 [Nocardia arthritidis]
MTAAFVVGERVSEMFRRGLHVTEIDVDIPLLDYGLDSVRSAELVIELERAFGVEITDAEAAELYTARDVIDCVTTKMGHTGVGA